jgi:hypothetical protein
MIYAAGSYETEKNNLDQIHTSLATLVRARQQLSRDASTRHFVAIGQANLDLAGVAQRLAPVMSSRTATQQRSKSYSITSLP